MRNKKLKQSFIKRYRHNIMSYALQRGVTGTLLISGGLAAICVFGFCYILLFNWLDKNDRTRVEVEKVEAENLRGKAVEKSQPLFENEFRKLVELSDSAEPLLPKLTELNGVMLGVQQVAKRHNITMTGLNAVKESVKSPLAEKLYEREIPAQVKGTYGDVVRFFYDLANLSRIIVVKDFQLIAGNNNQVTANFILAAFHAPPPKEIPVLPAFLQTFKGTEKPQIAEYGVEREERKGESINDGK